MHRTARFLASLLAMLALLAPWAGPHAQNRTIPAAARLGVLQVTQFPQGMLDEKPVRLAPGARVFNEGNIIILPTALASPTPVRYRLDGTGQVLDVWVLTPAALDRARADAASKENAAR